MSGRRSHADGTSTSDARLCGWIPADDHPATQLVPCEPTRSTLVRIDELEPPEPATGTEGARVWLCDEHRRELETLDPYRSPEQADAVGDATDPTRSPDVAAVEAYLHQHIPISAAMGITVEVIEPDQVTLAAPLEPNVNHRSTVFGGSCASVAILAAWTLVHLHVSAIGPARVVIQHGATDYLAPITGSFRATCRVEQDAWQRFDTAFRRKGRARIELEALVEAGGVPVATFRGTYVALGIDDATG